MARVQAVRIGALYHVWGAVYESRPLVALKCRKDRADLRGHAGEPDGSSPGT